ncbi:MAG: DNA alkylation repair protein [Bacteroidetes bacterium]|nr:DNA alkylation repair protein [Bacteroidota bacterium]
MTTKEILDELKLYGSDSIKKVFFKHGAKEPFYGVKVADLKKIQKKIKKNYALSLELYDTGNTDAMYLAGLIADDKKMTKENLNHWVKNAYWYMISEFTVAWVAAESNFGHEMALEWIKSSEENIASAGWATYANLVTLLPDEQLNIAEIKSLIETVEKEIHQAQNRVKQTMNGFVIAVGGSILELTDFAIEKGKKIGMVSVDMGETACKTPFIPEYIEKIRQRGALGKKKKTVKC